MDTFVTEKSKDYSLVDNHTGEILEFRKTRKVSMEDFMVVYLTSYSDMLKLTGMQMKVLLCCWRYSAFNDRNCNSGNIIYNDKVFKDNCRRDGLDTSDAVINNAISQLVKYGFLIKKCKGNYLLNPRYFFKGTLSDRTKIQYNIMVEPEEKKTRENIKAIEEELAEQTTSEE